MFGYIKPFKPELKIREFETYKAVYCGLCGQLGKRFGAFARLTLSYDFTFLCMLHYALSDEQPCFAAHRCYVNPLKKLPMCGDSAALRASADIAAIMIYYKLLDNIHDGGIAAKLGGTIVRPFVAAAHKKAAAAQPLADKLVADSMVRQAALEAAGCNSVDEACEPTAAAMAGICMLLSPDPRQQRVLERFGYLIGRFAYLCDALDDMERDTKSGNYNPFVARYHDAEKSLADIYIVARESLYMTIGEIGKTCALLEINKFQPVIDNVVHLGLRASVDEILSKKEKSE